MRHAVIGAGFRVLKFTGAARALAPFARGRGVVLTFHHVRPPSPDPFRPNALLEITPAFLDTVLGAVRRLGFEIVPLDAVPERLASRGGPPFVALTFDDGYRDNADHALPILKRHGAPWTLFVTTDYADGLGRLWWIELEEVVRRSPVVRLGDVRHPAGTPAEKRSAFAALYRDLRAGPEDRLRDTLAAWLGQLGLEPEELVRSLCLGWNDIVALAGEPGVAIGAHTCTHPMLAKHGPEFARREIVQSGRAIADRIGRPVPTFSYPVGDPTSAGAREFAMAEAAGYRLAVTTRPGHVFDGHGDHLFALPRISVNGLHQSEDAIVSLLSGAPFLVWNRGRRLHVA